MERDTSSSAFPLGSELPAFDLPNAAGGRLTDAYLREGRAALVVFGCNHCPYVKGSEGMLVRIVQQFAPQGLRCVVINSNDAIKYPEDSFDKMVEKSSGQSLPYPYLYDETQSVARSFDAACTPEFYLFTTQGTLVYHGTINDSPRDPSKVTKDYLSSAIAAVIAGETPNPQFVHPLGCSIKWK